VAVWHAARIVRVTALGFAFAEAGRAAVDVASSCGNGLLAADSSGPRVLIYR
jgi:hypothetical protein